MESSEASREVLTRIETGSEKGAALFLVSNYRITDLDAGNLIAMVRLGGRELLDVPLTNLEPLRPRR